MWVSSIFPTKIVWENDGLDPNWVENFFLNSCIYLLYFALCDSLPHPSSSSSVPASAVSEQEKHALLPPLFLLLLCIPHSDNNFVKHAKPPKSPARDRDSCAAPQPGRCKGRTDLCNAAGTRCSPECTRTQKHPESEQKGAKKSQSDWINDVLCHCLKSLEQSKKWELNVSVTSISGNLMDIQRNTLVNSNNHYGSFMAFQGILRGLQVEVEGGKKSFCCSSGLYCCCVRVQCERREVSAPQHHN